MTNNTQCNETEKPLNHSTDKTDTMAHATKQTDDLPTAPPKIPTVLIVILVVINGIIGLAPLRNGRAWENWLDVLYQWGVLFVFVPLGLTLFAVPLKIRDKSFQLKHVYYFGMFAAGLFTLQNLRHLH